MVANGRPDAPTTAASSSRRPNREAITPGRMQAVFARLIAATIAPTARSSEAGSLDGASIGVPEPTTGRFATSLGIAM